MPGRAWERPSGEPGFDQGPAERCEEPPVAVPGVGDAFEQFRLPGVEIVEAAETEQPNAVWLRADGYRFEFLGA